VDPPKFNVQIFAPSNATPTVPVPASTVLMTLWVATSTSLTLPSVKFVTHTNGGVGTVSEIDPATHSVVNTVTVGSGPRGVAFDGSHARDIDLADVVRA